MLYPDGPAFLRAPHKRVMLFGMSGLGKTTLSNMLREAGDWFHYSVDYRIGTRYMGEYISDNFKREAMKVPLLRELLMSDSVFITSNITFDNLAPLSTYLGKPGDPARGGVPFEEYLRRHADRNYYVIAYINCSAEVKALSDCICTSGNAVRIVESVPADRNILFVPDANLGSWVMEQTGRKMDLWQGACYVHVEFTRDSILRIKEQYPDAPVVAHPECTFAVRLLADEVCSTEKMVHFCRRHPARQFIIATESGMLHRLRRECPEKEFIAGPTHHCACADCRYMKMNSMEKLMRCLRDLSPQVVLPEDLRARAEKPLLRMLELSR
jgi:quinolinate synthetase A subunit